MEYQLQGEVTRYSVAHIIKSSYAFTNIKYNGVNMYSKGKVAL
jgi:hypothetical protein